MEKKTTAAKPVVKTTAKEASKDTVKEAAVKSAPAKESVKETAAETKAAAVAKEVEKKVAETKETVKDTAKKATEKVEAATKTVVKKAAAKKAAPKKEELKPEVFIQFQGQEAVVADVIEKAKKQFDSGILKTGRVCSILCDQPETCWKSRLILIHKIRKQQSSYKHKKGIASCNSFFVFQRYYLCSSLYLDTSFWILSYGFNRSLIEESWFKVSII